MQLFNQWLAIKKTSEKEYSFEFTTKKSNENIRKRFITPIRRILFVSTPAIEIFFFVIESEHFSVRTKWFSLCELSFQTNWRILIKQHERLKYLSRYFDESNKNDAILIKNVLWMNVFLVFWIFNVLVSNFNLWEF